MSTTTTLDPTMHILLAQLTPGSGDLERNTTVVELVLRDYPGIDLAVFPELYLSGYHMTLAPPLAMSRDSTILARVREAAARANAAVVVGFPERLASGGVGNSVACIDRNGRLAGVYRKTHLFGGEAEAFEAGNSLLVVTLAGRRIGLLICFDIEFPEPARALAVAGAELLVTVSANMTPYTYDHELASRARAFDNRLPHVYVNRVGDEDGFHFVGASRVVLADGHVALQAGSDDEILVAEVEPGGHVADSNVDYLQHRRGELPVEVH